MGRILLILSAVLAVVIVFFITKDNLLTPKNREEQPQPRETHPLSIKGMRQRLYPGSDITIEQTLQPGDNYNQYSVSYKSEGLKIYGLLTIPIGEKPKAGYPVIVFNHGYIPPEQYKTTERYVVYVDFLAKNGYAVFKSDYRGHGNSEGNPEGAYYSPAYTIDVLNAVSSIKRFKDINPEKIGMWGHSLGGNLTLRSMVVSKDIKAGVIWSGVVGTYDELLNKWRRTTPFTPSDKEVAGHVSTIRKNLLEKYGSPQDNPQFWQSIDPRYFLKDVSGPIELHHSLSDQEVPPLFSESLKNDLEKEGKIVKFYTYPDSDHNLSGSAFNLAMERTIEFFNQYLK